MLQHKLTNLFILVLLVATVLSPATVSAAPTAQQVSGSLIAVKGDTATFEVSANGEYVLLQEDNIASEQLKATAKNGKVAFQMKPGNKAMRLENIVATSEVANWQPCSGASDWLCLLTQATTIITDTMAPPSRNDWESHYGYPCGLWKWDGKTTWTWAGEETDQVCESDWHLGWMYEGDTFKFTIPASWENGAAVDAVWGKMSGAQTEKWVGRYITKNIKPGAYSWTDNSKAPNMGFRAKPAEPPKTPTTNPPVKAEKPGYCSWFIVGGVAWFLGLCP